MVAEPFEVVPLAREELGALAPLWDAVRRHHLAVGTVLLEGRDGTDSWTIRRAHYEAALGHGGFVLAARTHAGVVGYACVALAPPSATWNVDRIATLETLAVAPQHRGRGIGTALARAAFERLAGWGVEQVTLTVVDGNDDAARLYRRLGFVPSSARMIRALERPAPGPNDIE